VTIRLARARAGTPELEAALARLERRGETDLARVEPAVREVLDSVRSQGDRAVLRYVERFESRSPDPLLIRQYAGAEALARLAAPVRAALEQAAARIERYHRRQAQELRGFSQHAAGVTLESRVTPLARVGVYAPGGKASYPSSVLMCAIVARVAGVAEVIVATPDATPEVRAACQLCGVSAILDAGGAQAIAALAYGTESVPRVDKIVGPGNLYVAAAKRMVFGQVSIDSIAGPSEILVVADGSADPRLIAADLLSQAEHDEAAYPLLLTSHEQLVDAVETELARQLVNLPRKAIAEQALGANAVAIVVAERTALFDVANRLAAEHVALHVERPREAAERIVRAGALFVGPATPEAAGDYLAGPSHVLPTGGAARHSGPLSVFDFVSRSSVIEYTPEALAAQADAIEALARAEGLEAHARAVRLRVTAR
jgi:histidinol dehydrogenase